MSYPSELRFRFRNSMSGPSEVKFRIRNSASEYCFKRFLFCINIFYLPVCCEDGKELPVMLNDHKQLRIVGKKLQVKKIYLHMIAQFPDQLPVTEEAWLEDFLTTYGATHTLSKDPLTGFDILTIEGWNLGEKELTVESVE